MEFDNGLKIVWRDLILKHHQAARDKDEQLRLRLLNMIDLLESVYPQLSDWHV